MLKKYKNALLQTIQNAGISPEKFVVDETIVEGLNAFVIKYQHSELCFIARTPEDSYDLFDCKYTKLAPKFPMSDFFPSEGFTDITKIAAQLNAWLSRHLTAYIDELSTPDLWLEATAQANFVHQSFPKSPADAFSAEEKEQVRVSLANVRLLIQETYKPNETQQALVNERLEYLSNAVDRLSKFDWRGVMLSTMIGISTNLSLDTTQGAQLLQLFKRAFSGVVHLLQ